MTKNYNTGVFICLSGNASLTVSSLKKMIKYLADFGYSYVELGLDDLFKIDEEPYYGYLRGAYSVNDLKELDSYAKSVGIELIPSAQCLGHFWVMSKLPEYEPIMDVGDILLIDSPRVKKLLDNMFSTLRKSFSTNKINIGFDEAHLVGLGKYLDQNGYVNRFELMLKHLNLVNNIANKYNFQCHMWSDMFFKMANHGIYYDKGVCFDENVINLVPKNVGLCYWDYYNDDEQLVSEMIKSHEQFNRELYFAGSISTCSGFAPSNKASLKIFKAQMECINKSSINNILITLWGDNGNDCNYFAALPGLFMTHEYAVGNYDENQAKKKFKRITGEDYDSMMKLDIVERNKINPKNEKVTLISKALFYNDPFMGLKDMEVKEIGYIPFAEAHQELDEEYKKTTANFGYLYKKLSQLSLFLSYKYDIGIRTRDAYEKNDIKKLKAVIDQYDLCISSLKDFRNAFEEEWKMDYKMQGWDVQELRIGGLLARLIYCRDTLIKYKNKEIAKIEELEEPLKKFGNLDSLFNIYRTFSTLRDL
ncbi:MAG: hypothetical protein MJ227_04190 [Bacilli bacterium]|nr:hypothetical protein [Bacilli bacterium]